MFWYLDVEMVITYTHSSINLDSWRERKTSYWKLISTNLLWIFIAGDTMICSALQRLHWHHLHSKHLLSRRRLPPMVLHEAKKSWNLTLSNLHSRFILWFLNICGFLANFLCRRLNNLFRFFHIHAQHPVLYNFANDLALSLTVTVDVVLWCESWLASYDSYDKEQLEVAQLFSHDHCAIWSGR